MVSLSRNVSRKHAMEMAAHRRHVEAARAAEIGLINRVVPAGEELARAIALAQKIASKVVLRAQGRKQAFINRPRWGWRKPRLRSEVMTENMMARDARKASVPSSDKRKPTWEDLLVQESEISRRIIDSRIRTYCDLPPPLAQDLTAAQHESCKGDYDNSAKAQFRRRPVSRLPEQAARSSFPLPASRSSTRRRNNDHTTLIGHDLPAVRPMLIFAARSLTARPAHEQCRIVFTPAAQRAQAERRLGRGLRGAAGARLFPIR